MRYATTGNFVGNTITLMVGTIIAQIISIIISPILTRLYTPNDFGVVALYISLSSILGILATSRYDLAIMLPKEDKDAINIAILSIIITISISIITFITVLLFKEDIAKILNSREIAEWLYLLPVSVAIIGIAAVVSCWANRKSLYPILSLNKILAAAVTSGMSLMMGLLKAGANGLIIGSILGYGTSTAVLTYRVWNLDKEKVVYVGKKAIGEQAKRYYKFPLYSLPSELVNMAAQQSPIILLNIFFTPTITGFFSLTQRVLAMPIILISQSVLSVFRDRASKDFNAHGNCREIYLKTLKYLLLFSIGPFITFYLISPWLFPFVYGKQWSEAGKYAQILCPLFFFRFISNPLSYVLFIMEKQKFDLLGQILLLLFSVISISVGGHLNSPKLSIIFFSVSYSIIYIFYLVSSYHFSKGNSILKSNRDK